MGAAGLLLQAGAVMQATQKKGLDGGGLHTLSVLKLDECFHQCLGMICDMNGKGTCSTSICQATRKGKTDTYCYGFEDDGPRANTVLGAVWMMHKDGWV